MMRGMRAVPDRFRRLSAAFTTTVEDVPDDAWGDPSPCEGWVARDVVRHLVEWLPAFFLDGWGLDRPPIPSVDEDPVGAWIALRDALQAALDDPEIAGRRQADPHLGELSYAEAVATIALPDILVHTWDLARAAGLDDTLDAEEVAIAVAGIGTYDDAPMRASGHFGPAVELPAGGGDQDRLLAFMGRTP
jgi:uncharacterized protein (TIGR03086 family)